MDWKLDLDKDKEPLNKATLGAKKQLGASAQKQKQLGGVKAAKDAANENWLHAKRIMDLEVKDTKDFLLE